MPQEVWNPKDDRQYQHIKESGMSRGQSEARAEGIAARTVNKRRRQEGRTRNRRTMGTRNPNLPLSQRTRDDTTARRSIRGAAV
jgi:hypothetical protein